jgi:hypothetical protein
MLIVNDIEIRYNIKTGKIDFYVESSHHKLFDIPYDRSKFMNTVKFVDISNVGTIYTIRFYDSGKNLISEIIVDALDWVDGNGETPLIPNDCYIEFNYTVVDRLIKIEGVKKILTDTGKDYSIIVVDKESDIPLGGIVFENGQVTEIVNAERENIAAIKYWLSQKRWVVINLFDVPSDEFYQFDRNGTYKWDNGENTGIGVWALTYKDNKYNIHLQNEGNEISYLGYINFPVEGDIWELNDTTGNNTFTGHSRNAIFNRVELAETEANIWSTMNTDILSKQIEYILIQDETAVDNAITTFNQMSAGAKRLKLLEKSLLDSFKVEIEIQKGVEQWKLDHDAALSLTLETVTENDQQTIILYAINSYYTLETPIQIRLVNELNYLTELYDFMTPEDYTEQFRNSNSEILSRTIDTLELADLNILYAALALYDTLELEAKMLLTIEKQLLDELSVQMNYIVEADVWLNTYAVVLAITVNSLTEDEQNGIVTDALNDLLNLSSGAQALLTIEKQHLLDLIGTLTPFDISEQWKVDNNIVLSLTVSTISLTDKSILDTAFDTYNDLNDATKAYLTTEKQLLDELLVKWNELKAIEDAEVQDMVDKIVGRWNISGLDTTFYEFDNNGNVRYEEDITFENYTYTITKNNNDFILTINRPTSTPLTGNIVNYNDGSQPNQRSFEVNESIIGTMLYEEYPTRTHEADVWQANNMNILSKTIDTLVYGDKQELDDAVMSLAALSYFGKLEVPIVKRTLISSLNSQMNYILEAEQWKTDNSAVLVLTVDTITEDEQNGILVDALTSYDALSDIAKLYLSTEKSLLDALQATNTPYDLAQIWKNNNNTVLSLTVDTVTIGHENDVADVLESYALLPLEVKSYLVNEKTLLDELRAKIIELKIQQEADTFRTTYAAVLALTVDTITEDEQDGILVDALIAYGNLSDAAKAILSTEKSLLDALRDTNTPYDLAQIWKTAHATILAKLPANITLSDNDAITNANVEYDILNQATKDELVTEKNLLDILTQTLNTLIDDEKNNFTTTHSMVLGLDINDLTLTTKTDIETALSDYDSLNNVIKAQLTTEKQLLDELYQRILDLEAIEGFETAYATTLALTVDTVQFINQTDIENALANIETYSGNSYIYSELNQYKIYLNTLISKINELTVLTADAFLQTYTNILSKDSTTIRYNDKTNLENAILDFDTQYQQVQDYLLSSFPNIRTNLEEMNNVFINSYDEATDYLTNHATILAVQPDTIDINDLSTLAQDRIDFNAMNNDAKTLLYDEDELLAALEIRYVDLETVNTFRTNHAYVLSLSGSTVTPNDTNQVLAALNDYNSFNDEVKALLITEKQLLDELIASLGI